MERLYIVRQYALLEPIFNPPCISPDSPFNKFHELPYHFTRIPPFARKRSHIPKSFWPEENCVLWLCRLGAIPLLHRGVLDAGTYSSPRVLSILHRPTVLSEYSQFSAGTYSSPRIFVILGTYIEFAQDIGSSRQIPTVGLEFAICWPTYSLPRILAILGRYLQFA